jgi:hypothetical protein
MALPNIFTQPVANGVIERINKLTPQTTPEWGKMNVSQMLAHCNVTYEMLYEPEKHPSPNPFMKLILKLLVKKKVVSEIPYKRNGPTAAAFIIKGDKKFEDEKARLTAYISKTQELGESAFESRMSHSFGVLTADEWNNMLYKHLNHHLTQFRV